MLKKNELEQTLNDMKRKIAVVLFTNGIEFDDRIRKEILNSKDQ